MKAKILTLILIFYSVLLSKSYFVSPTGDNNNPGTYTLPWKTIGYALCGGNYNCGCTTVNPNTISAGDTLYLRSGLYDVSAEIANNKPLHFKNTGTEEQPIVIRNYPGEIPIIDGGYSGIIFSLGAVNFNNFIIFDSLVIQKGRVAGIIMGLAKKVNNIIIRNCKIMDIQYHDNTGCVYLSNSWDKITVKNCYLKCRNPSGAVNVADIYVFKGNNNFEFTNNELDSSNYGIFIKHGVIGSGQDDPRKPIIKNNIIKNTKYGISSVTDNLIIQNNLLLNTPILIFPGVGSDCIHMGGFHTLIDHNTIINSTISLGCPLDCPERGARFTTISNNVIVSNEKSILNIWEYCNTDSIGSPVKVDYNLFYSTKTRPFTQYTGNTYTFQSWKLSLSSDAHSIFAAPIFQNTITYPLASNSPGVQNTSDGTVMGVDVSKLGINPQLSTTQYSTPIDKIHKRSFIKVITDGKKIVIKLDNSVKESISADNIDFLLYSLSGKTLKYLSIKFDSDSKEDGLTTTISPIPKGAYILEARVANIKLSTLRIMQLY
jgi:hypothetical protein